MNAMVPFVFEDSPLRVCEIDGVLWFVARDICKALGIASPQRAYARIPEDEKGVLKTHTLGGEQDVLGVSEPGFYRLTFRSNKPVAERLRRFVFHEVLPAIRRTGRYEPEMDHATAPSAEAFGLDVDIGRLNAHVHLVRLCERLKGKAAANRLWAMLGLPDPGPDDAGLPQGGRPRSHGEERADIVLRFLAARTVPDRRGAVRAEVMRRAYARWAAETDAPELSPVEFGIALAKAGVSKRKAPCTENRTQVYIGLRLVDDALGGAGPLPQPEGAWQ